jgi:hypothetical protein
MSSTYAKPTVVRPAVGRSQRRSGLLGLGAVLAGVTAVGAAVTIFLIPAEAPPTAPAVPLPAMDASFGFWDYIDTRPAVSRSDTSMGFWDVIDTRPAVRELPAMPASMGHWDFTLPAEPTGRSLGTTER